MPKPNRDLEHLNRLRDYYAEHPYIPTFQRIKELMGFASRAASSKLLARLESAGYIERAPDSETWIPSARFFERHLADAAVRAGAPDMIEGTSGELFLIDQYLVRQPSSTVVVPVTGDSMMDAGIQDGDRVIVERSRSAKAGDFVVAVVDGEFTLKELIVEKGKFALKPHNPAYPIIRPKGQLEIYGVVTGLVRRFTP